MDITIVSIGSRGDVQPFVALALGLLDNGHQVTIAAPQNFENFVKSFGINFHALPNNTEEVITSVEGEKLLKKGSTIGILKFFKREGTKRRVAIRSSLLECCVNTELIITSYITTYAIAIISEKLNSIQEKGVKI